MSPSDHFGESQLPLNDQGVKALVLDWSGTVADAYVIAPAVVFVEVKTGQSRLNTVEKSLKDAVEQGKVSWAEYRHK